MSIYNTPNRLCREYASNDGRTPSPARFRAKGNLNEENAQLKNQFESHFDENANDQFHNDNSPRAKLQEKNNNKPTRTPKPSLEEEQEELKRSLSKDWCDQMDNVEAEEKKLHSFVLYLKQFPVHEKKSTEELLVSIECCPKELLRRQKEISKGKLSNPYQSYISTISRKSRTRQHPRTPCKYAKMSRRGFDGAIKAWRRKLYDFSEDKAKENNDDDSVCSSQRSDSGQSTASISMDENFLPDLYDFEELLANEVQDMEAKSEPFVEVDVADSMDTVINNVDSCSAMALDD